MQRLSALSTHRVLPLPTGDTTTALIEFRNGATGTIATTLKTPFVWRLAIYGADQWVESTGETRIVVGRAGKEPEVKNLPQVNHVGANLESFARAALGQGQFHIGDDGIVHTVAALEAVFKSADANGAWQAVE
jgi:hypothetical protein